MKVIICPGIHAPELTESFLGSVVKGDWGSGGAVGARGAGGAVGAGGAEGDKGAGGARGDKGAWEEEKKLDVKWLVLPTEKYAPYSPLAVYHWLNKAEILTNELLFITFSAGVVGGMGAAIALQNRGVKIKGFIAIDGWGVPLWGNFPIYRLSHDYFTHWSSALLGTGQESFYADPPVEHLMMWRSPETCHGWIISDSAPKIRCSAKDYLQRIIVYCSQEGLSRLGGG